MNTTRANMEGGPDVIVPCLPLHCMLDQLNALMGLADSSAKWASVALPCPFLFNMTTRHRRPFFMSQSRQGNLYQKAIRRKTYLKKKEERKKENDRPILMMQWTDWQPIGAYDHYPQRSHLSHGERSQDDTHWITHASFISINSLWPWALENTPLS